MTASKPAPPSASGNRPVAWTTPGDLQAQVRRLWERGALLEAEVTGQAAFPLRLALKRPSSKELSERFSEARAWIAALRGLANVRVVMREFRHPNLGPNQVPDQVWIDTLSDAVDLIGKTRDLRRFGALVGETQQRLPAVLPWLARHPLKGLELASEWARLLDVVCWLQAHPRPGCYVRQMDVPGVHTKFVELHRGVLSHLFDLAMPPDAIDHDASIGAAGFCRRYGFRDKPLRIRFRCLDPDLALLQGSADSDLTVDFETFSVLNLEPANAFVTENEINYLAFPQVKRSIVIFSSGYGFDALAPARWLERCAVYYWGDVDTHGFAILDGLRASFPHAQSLLMDRQTLHGHKDQWVVEDQPVRRELARLHPHEREVYDDLRRDRLGVGVRLEQEKVGFSRLIAALDGLK